MYVSYIELQLHSDILKNCVLKLIPDKIHTRP